MHAKPPDETGKQRRHRARRSATPQARLSTSDADRVRVGGQAHAGQPHLVQRRIDGRLSLHAVLSVSPSPVSLILDEHRHYLSDTVKIDAFRRAVAEVVRPGAVVCDLASGTSILGLFACEAGAARVYSVEMTGMVEVARAIAAANGFGGRLIPVIGSSTEVELPERVDAIICDQVGHFGDRSRLDSVRSRRQAAVSQTGRRDAACRRLPSGRAVEAPDQAARVEFWTGRPAGFDFSCRCAGGRSTPDIPRRSTSRLSSRRRQRPGASTWRRSRPRPSSLARPPRDRARRHPARHRRLVSRAALAGRGAVQRAGPRQAQPAECLFPHRPAGRRSSLATRCASPCTSFRRTRC